MPVATVFDVSGAEVPVATVFDVSSAEVPVATVFDVSSAEVPVATVFDVSSAEVPVATNFPTALVPVSTLAYHTTQRSTDRPNGRQDAVDSGESTQPTALTFCVCVQLALCQPTTTATNNTNFLSVPNLIKHLFNTAVDHTNLTQPY